MTRVLTAFVLGMCVSACGGSPTAPSIAQVAGVWSYTSTQTSISGGECVGQLLSSSIGSVDRGTFSVTQTGSSLTGTSRSASSGLSCMWTGTAGSSSMALSWSTCDAAVFTGIHCANGALRDMRLVASSISATVLGNTANGTGAETYNISVSGTSSGVGALSSNYSWTAVRQ